MAYTAWSVVFGEQPSAAKWNQLGENDAGFKDGTNIDDAAITPAKRTGGFAAGSLPVTSAGAASITGLSFQPKFLRLYGVVTSNNVISSMANASFNGTTIRCQAIAGSGSAGFSRYYTVFAVINTSPAQVINVDTFAFTSDGFSFVVNTQSPDVTAWYEAFA